MRKAVNENPMVQIGLLAVLAIAAGLLLITRMGGGSSETPPAATTPAPTSPATASPATSAPEASVAPSSTPETTAPSPNEAGPDGSAPSTDFVAGPGLPKPVVEAYDGGDAVVLMIYRRKGVDDPFVYQAKRLIEALPASSGVEATVFLIQARDIARYSRITGGVDVNRVPAIVVIKPKDLSDGAPTASVSYGVRGPASVVQTVKDALYDGRELPYYPR